MSRFRTVFLWIGLLSSLLISVNRVSAKERPTTRAEVVPSSGKLKLAFPGLPGPAHYEETGHFDGIGTKQYRYVITDQEALSKQVGEGIFPNSMVTRDPRFKQLSKEGKLNGNHWTFADGKDAELAFYKWASVNEDPGVKLFMTSIM